MQSNTIRWRPIVVTALLCCSSYLWFGSPESAAQPGDVTVQEEARFHGFPESSKLLTLFDNGKLEGTRRPSAAEVTDLQGTIDVFNELWHDAKTRQHAQIKSVCDEMIDRGEVSAIDATSPLPALREAEGAIGVRLVVRDGQTYLIQLFPGKSSELDAITSELRELKELGRETIFSYFDESTPLTTDSK